jgi:hypothetical protein
MGTLLDVEAARLPALRAWALRADGGRVRRGGWGGMGMGGQETRMAR